MNFLEKVKNLDFYLEFVEIHAIGLKENFYEFPFTLLKCGIFILKVDDAFFWKKFIDCIKLFFINFVLQIVGSDVLNSDRNFNWAEQIDWKSWKDHIMSLEN